MMQISVVVITARENCGFEDLVRSLQQSEVELRKHDCTLQLIWVHRGGGQKQELYSKAMDLIPEIDFKYIDDEPLHKGPCPAGARNAGIKACAADWIVCVDDLTTFYPETLLAHAKVAQMGADACVGTFDVQLDDGKVRPSFEADSRMKDPKKSDGEWASNHFYGMHMGFSPRAWVRVGGFDELFDGVYGQEDCDFGLRLWRAGCSVLWLEQARVLCYRGVKHNSTHEYLFTDPSEVPTAHVAGVPKWRNDALIQWNTIIGKVIANRGEINE